MGEGGVRGVCGLGGEALCGLCTSADVSGEERTQKGREGGFSEIDRGGSEGWGLGEEGGFFFLLTGGCGGRGEGTSGEEAYCLVERGNKRGAQPRLL